MTRSEERAPLVCSQGGFLLCLWVLSYQLRISITASLLSVSFSHGKV